MVYIISILLVCDCLSLMHEWYVDVFALNWFVISAYNGICNAYFSISTQIIDKIVYVTISKWQFDINT